MSNFNTPYGVSTVRKYRTLIVAMIVLFAGGAGLAATGGVQAVKQWFVTVKLIGADGETEYNALLVEVDENGGTTTIDLAPKSGKQGTVETRRLDSGELELNAGQDSGESVVATLTLESDGNDQEAAQATIIAGSNQDASISVTSADGKELLSTMSLTISGVDLGAGLATPTGSGQPVGTESQVLVDRVGRTNDARGEIAGKRIRSSEAVLAELAKTDAVDHWYDDDGFLRELYVIPMLANNATQPGTPGLHVVATHIDDAGAKTFRYVASVAGVNPATTELAEINWSTTDEATLLFVRADGQELTIKINTDPKAVAADTGKRVRIKLDDAASKMNVQIRTLSPQDR